MMKEPRRRRIACRLQALRRVTDTNHDGEVTLTVRVAFLQPTGSMAMCSIHTDSGVVTYEAVRTAMNGEPYTMSLTGKDETLAVIEAVNQGIDSHLEACYCPERGDRYEGGARKAGRLVLCRTLECHVSVESLPTLLRRLFDLNADDDLMDAASSLARDILTTLGFDEFGRFVGREALGLA